MTAASHIIRTPRLALVTLPRDLLDGIAAGMDGSAVLQSITQLAGDALEIPESRPPLPRVVTDPCGVLEEAQTVLAWRAEQLDLDPRPDELAPWLSRVVVWRASGELVGYTNFHDRPDLNGRVEIGYRVAPQWRRQGIATEVAEAMWAWAAEQGARIFVASIRPDNEASLRIIERAGFVQVGEQVDDIDGRELVFERSARSLRGTQGRREQRQRRRLR